MERIAIPTLNGMLCTHFGHCEVFTIVDIENGNILKKDVVVPPPHEPGVKPAWLKEKGVTVIIAGGMGARAQEIFAKSGIKVIIGAEQGKPEDLAMAYISGNLTAGKNLCDH